MVGCCIPCGLKGTCDLATEQCNFILVFMHSLNICTCVKHFTVVFNISKLLMDSDLQCGINFCCTAKDPVVHAAYSVAIFYILFHYSLLYRVFMLVPTFLLGPWFFFFYVQSL